jgi:PKD repeat protein
VAERRKVLQRAIKTGLFAGVVVFSCGLMYCLAVIAAQRTLAAQPVVDDTVSFDPAAVAVTTMDVVTAVVLSDFDRDGRIDLAFGAGNRVAIASNASTSTVALMPGPVAAVAAADFNLDGRPDLAVAGASGLRLLRNPGTPFTAAWTQTQELTAGVPISVTSIVAGDLNHDGAPDVVSAGADGAIRLWQNSQGFGISWPAAVVLTTTGEAVNQVVLDDLDRDGWLDVVAVSDTGRVTAWRNPRSPFASAWTEAAIGGLSGEGLAVAVSDLDRDGAPDVVASGSAGLAAWRSPLDGTRAFTSAWTTTVTLATDGPAVSVQSADLDGDGYPELVFGTAGQLPRLQAWKLGLTPFVSAGRVNSLGGTTYPVRGLAVGDLDRDGDSDVAGGDGTYLFVWRNALMHRQATFNATGVDMGAVAATAMQTADLDRDGDADVITYKGSTLYAWTNDGTPFNSSWVSHTLGSCGSCLIRAVTDLDGDGYPDLILSKDIKPEQIQIWRNPGRPFDVAWTTRKTLGQPLALATALAEGDVYGTGNVAIVTAISGTATLSGSLVVWQAQGDPFSSNWASATIATLTSTVKALVLGDLNNDGRPDIVLGSVTAPPVGRADNPVPSSQWPDVYQVRALRNDGATNPGGWTAFDVGRTPTDLTVRYRNIYHGYWGANIADVAIADFDRDGWPDIITAGAADADYQLLAWHNNGAPFGALWQPTTLGFGPYWLTTGLPWLADAVQSVSIGDVNGDGWPDVVSGSQLNEPKQIIYWENSGVPFGQTITDTYWLRHGLISTGDYETQVSLADLDEDGYPDIVAAQPCCTTADSVHLWRNRNGAVSLTAAPAAAAGMAPGTQSALLRMRVSHNGRGIDHAAALAWWRLELQDGDGNPLTGAQIADLFDSLGVYVDGNGDGRWQGGAADPLVVSSGVTSATLGGGNVFTITFPFGGQPLSQIAATQQVTYFVVAKLRADVMAPSGFRIVFDADADALVEDAVTGAAVSLLDTTPVSATVLVDEAIGGLLATSSSPTKLGDATTFTSTPDGGTRVSYAWSFGDGGTDGGLNPPHTYGAPGVYTAVVTAANSVNVITSVVRVTVAIPVDGLVVVNDGPARLGSATRFTSTILTGTAVSYLWDFGDGSASAGGELNSHTYSATGVYTIGVSAFNAVSAVTGTTVVEVVDAPLAGLVAQSSSPTTLGAITRFTATLSSGTNVAYAWAFGDGAVAAGAQAEHAYTATGAYTVSLVALNSTGAMTVALRVVVLDAPLAGLIGTNDSPTRLGASTRLTGSVASGSNAVFVWAFGDGSFGAGAVTSHTYAATGVYTASVVAYNAVSAVTATTAVMIVDVPIGGLGAVNDSPTIFGASVRFTGTVASGTGVSYAWAFGDGNTGAGAVVTHGYAAAGTYTATVVALNVGSAMTATTSVVVVDVPPVGLAVSNDGPTMLDDATTFSASVAAGTNLTYTWAFGDGTSGAGATAQHTYTTIGAFTATFTAANSAGVLTGTTVVTVLPGRPYTLTLSGAPAQEYTGQPVTLTATVVDRLGNPVVDGTVISFAHGLDNVIQVQAMSRSTASLVFSSMKPGPYRVTATSGSAQATATVTFLARTFLPVGVKGTQ